MQKGQQLGSAIDVDELRKLCTDDIILITQHLSFRLRERGIKYDDVTNAIITGEIIEQYPADYPYPSCLVLGMSTNNKHLHAVCGVGHGHLWIVTAYYPDLNKWESDLKTRKGHDK